MAQQTVSLKLPTNAGPALRAQLRECDYAFSQVDHAHWQARGDAIVTLYRSGKLVVQGRHVEPWVLAAEELGGSVTKWAGGERGMATASTTSDANGAADPPSQDATSTRFDAAIAKLPRPAPRAWIGIDETGKGDYFGPLVVVAARVDLSQLSLLAELGVGDSKKIADGKIVKLAAQLKHIVSYEALVLMPRKYNELYEKIGNLNRLLAWAHAAAAEGLLEQGVQAELILSDQFAKTNIIGPKLKERARALRFVQRTKAEEDPAVACASILARAEFVRRLDNLAAQFDVQLAKGAGPPVLAAGRKLVAESGREVLRDVAKLHFKTTQQLG